MKTTLLLGAAMALALGSIDSTQAFTAAPRASGVVHSCTSGLDSIGNLVEPVRTFSNGGIRAAPVSTEEPAAAPDHLLIFVADKDNPMAVDCFAVSESTVTYDDAEPPGYRGFFSLSVANIRAYYDEARGLALRVPVTVSVDGIERPAGDVNVLINRAHGNSVTVQRRL